MAGTFNAELNESTISAENAITTRHQDTMVLSLSSIRARLAQALAAEASGSGAAERSLVLEIAALEREAAGGAAARRLRTAAARAAELEATAHEAIEGMQAAQRECGRPAR